jgi:hypothetical protein
MASDIAPVSRVRSTRNACGKKDSVVKVAAAPPITSAKVMPPTSPCPFASAAGSAYITG